MAEGGKVPVSRAIRDAAKALGRRGGLVGGPARARSMSKKQRSDIARLGAVATNKKRWPAGGVEDEGA